VSFGKTIESHLRTNSSAIDQLEKDAVEYRANLNAASEEQIEELHRRNMQDLLSFSQVIKDQMNKQEGVVYQKEPETRTQPSFGGHTTFKTDV